MNATRLAWFLAGVASGAAAGLLLSPRSGSENRQWIADRGFEGAGRIVGEERVERSRRAVARGKETKDFVRDSVDMIKRGKRLGRPLEDD